MRALALCVLVLAVASLAAAVEPARACSCVPPDPWSLLKQADGAFVGRLVSRREADQGRAVLTFRVERAVKGKIGSSVEVTTANNGAACGIGASVGQRIGLFLEREGDGWFGHHCWQVAPEDLLAAAALPAPNGKGPVGLFVGGRFGPARTLALDSKGRTLAYGVSNGWTVKLSPCPDGRRIAEIAEVGAGQELAIRDARNLRRIHRQALRLPGGRSAAELRCEDSEGSSVVIFARWPRGDGRSRSAIYRLADNRVTAVWQGTAYLSSLNLKRAYLNSGKRAARLVQVELRTGRTTGIAWLPRSPILVPDAGDRWLAGLTYRPSEKARLVVVDLTERPPDVKSHQLPTREVAGEVLWLPSRRIVVLAGYGLESALVFDRMLHTRSQFRWTSGDGTLVGSTVFGLGLNNQLLGARLPIGPMQVVRRLPGDPILIASATE